MAPPWPGTARPYGWRSAAVQTMTHSIGQRVQTWVTTGARSSRYLTRVPLLVHPSQLPAASRYLSGAEFRETTISIGASAQIISGPVNYPSQEREAKTRPSVCTDSDGTSRAVWRGVPGDDSLWTSQLTGELDVQFWQPPQQLSWVQAGNGPKGTVGIGIPGSVVGPTAASAGRTIYLAWQGVPGDDQVYFTQGSPGTGVPSQFEWSSQAPIDGVGTSGRPAIVTFGGLPFLAWKGVHDDHGIYTTRQV